jgi:hypothetical protein
LLVVRHVGLPNFRGAWSHQPCLSVAAHSSKLGDCVAAPPFALAADVNTRDVVLLFSSGLAGAFGIGVLFYAYLGGELRLREGLACVLLAVQGKFLARIPRRFS